MDWYEEEVVELIKRRDNLPYEPQTIFYGSSTIRLWESLYNDFKNCLPVNLGFGGSTLAACVWFFERIVAPVKSVQNMFIYAGDNDLGDGRMPEEVLIFFEELITKMNHHFPNLSWYYISIKPSISRWNIDDKIKRANELIEAEIKTQNNITFIDIYDAMLDENGYPNAAYFEEDGLHLSKEGYEVWKEALGALCLPAIK
jgi:lysophospholipase L1-like esterase